MIDLHFDLLTKLYISYLEKDFSFIEQFVKSYNKENVIGVIANLCFMSKDEMQAEYHKNYYNENISVIEMFVIVKQLLDKYLDKDIEVIMSIEGCDYVSIEDLDKLYALNLRSILPVWNEENKYGSGNRTDKGLTKDGIKFIIHAFELGIGVDLSHANKKTFDDIINLAEWAKNTGLDPIVFATHSNVYSLCDRDRNLTDEQLLKIKRLDGVVGLFSNRGFVYKNSLKNKTDNNLVIDMYLKHIKYLENLFGNLDNIAVSTDDMTFCADKDPEYYECPIFNYSSIKQDLTKALRTYYNDEDIEKILVENSQELFNKLNGNTKKINKNYK